MTSENIIVPNPTNLRHAMDWLSRELHPVQRWVQLGRSSAHAYVDAGDLNYWELAKAFDLVASGWLPGAAVANLDSHRGETWDGPDSECAFRCGFMAGLDEVLRDARTGCRHAGLIDTQPATRYLDSKDSNLAPIEVSGDVIDQLRVDFQEPLDMASDLATALATGSFLDRSNLDLIGPLEWRVLPSHAQSVLSSLQRDVDAAETIKIVFQHAFFSVLEERLLSMHLRDSQTKSV